MNKGKNSFVDLGSRGRLNKNNKLNDLTGKEWLKFTKSWFIHRPPRRKEDEILHPAKFPESLVEEFIKFFTKKNGWVLDPFMGTGSTLISAAGINRKSVGIELSKNYFRSSSKRISKRGFEKSAFPFNGDSLHLKELLSKNGYEKIHFDYTITSPPYWNQLMRNSLRQKNRKEKGLDTKYSINKNDIGNINSYEEFLEKQAQVFDQVYDVTKSNGYLTIITNNVYFEGRLYPLAFDTAISLTKRGEKSWVLKDEKIWLQDDKKLIALGVNNAWVGNRHHQYCLIFRKEK
ncbi:MAG: site-specific DNA-methyltransferase [Ignavibacteriales bacterium]|nr:MAG: site-specific DNA-methyltransferase [Ignavibacteriales bacterium]